jgi:undecaprenyl diphosphate synthase
MGIEYCQAYLRSAALGHRLVRELTESSVDSLSFFLMSLRTLERPTEELSGIIQALNVFLERLLVDYSECAPPLRPNILGRLEGLPKRTRTLLLQLQKYRERLINTRRDLNLLIGYSGSASLSSRATCRLLKDTDLTKHCIGESPEFSRALRRSDAHIGHVDLVIRTGEFFRLSDAPILETANSVAVLLPKLFPETSANDFRSVIERYLDWRSRHPTTGVQE